MNGGGGYQGRRLTMARTNDLRLEGIVIQKRLTRAEATRYLVMDMNAGSIAVYKNPPPKDDGFGGMDQRSKSMPAKILNSVSPRSFKRSTSDEGGKKSQSMYENLAHLSREPRYFSDPNNKKLKAVSGVTWEPKFVASSNIDWKIRDVENDETMFYLILPADFKEKDSSAEVFATTKVGNSVSYRRLDVNSPKRLDSVPEDEQTAGSSVGNTLATSSMGSVGKYGGSDDGSVSSVSSSGSKKNKWSPLRKKGCSEEGHEVVYQYRVLLDGNEKFIWLQAAAELGRLCPSTAVSLVSSTVDVTKKLFVLPSMGPNRSNLRALRYAEWARLIDQKKNVSRFHFDVHDIDESAPQDKSLLDDSGRYNTTRLVKVVPSYAYRNRRMTEKDLYYEMTTTSEKWEDFREQTVGDRPDDEMIGSLHVEVLACHGLPKLDKLSSTDAVCYFVCGPYAFASDVIDGFLSPVWPSKSRRACIFPLFQAYQKLYAAVFDDDGPNAHDDFAGRVVVDVARLRPGSVYDIFLPLRLYQNAYVRKARGVIHLRLRVEWEDEKKALLSYLKLPTKTKQLDNAVTVNCADHKAFRNVVMTVQGKDVPGRYKQMIQKGLQREMKLYKFVMKTTMKEQMKDIILYVHPLHSFSIFVAWMHCVYTNSIAYVPCYFMLGIISLLLRNYRKYGMGANYHFGFTPITLKEVFQVLLRGGPGTKIIKPINVDRQTDLAKKASAGGHEADMDLHESIFQGGGTQMDGDHMEFPFSERGRYRKKTLSEACVDASAIFDEDEEGEQKSSGKFSLIKKGSKGIVPRIPKANREDDEEDEEDEFGDVGKNTMTPNINSALNGTVSVQKSVTRKNSLTSTTEDNDDDEIQVPDEVWKRVTDPRGLPEQDPTVFVKSRKSLKEEIIHNKNLMHKMSMRLFDDRLYIINEDDAGTHAAGEEVALNQAIGLNKYKSPIMAKIAEYAAPGLEGLKVGLSVWRVGFNLFTWRDPFLTSLFLFGVTFLLCVLIVFPWRLFFFVAGVGAVGPQNLLIRKMKKPKKKVKKTEDTSSSPKSKKKKTTQVKFSDGVTKNFQFHNHLATDQGIDVREERMSKSTSAIHRAVVPNSPLISRRFYDWPPNPSLSKVDIYDDASRRQTIL